MGSHCRYAAGMPECLDEAMLDRARRSLARRDRRLRALIREVGPCGLERRGDPYRSLLRSVIFQQLAGGAARAIDQRFRAPYRGRYPKPSDLLAAQTAALRRAGLSRCVVVTPSAINPNSLVPVNVNPVPGVYCVPTAPKVTR